MVAKKATTKKAAAPKKPAEEPSKQVVSEKYDPEIDADRMGIKPEETVGTEEVKEVPQPEPEVESSEDDFPDGMPGEPEEWADKDPDKKTYVDMTGVFDVDND